MSPFEATEEIKRLVVTASGYSVHAEPDAGLRTLATVTMARGPLPAHIIRFSPAAGSRDYLVAFQCGFILRAFQVPPTDRFDIVSNYRGRKEAERLVSDHLRKIGQRTSGSTRLAFAEQMYSGLILQLRSVPIGLRIDDWLARDYPILREQQETSIRRQLSDNASGLRPDVTRIAPQPILAANASMNAAFARYWARTWSDDTMMTLYKAAGFASRGDELLQVWSSMSPGAAADKDLIIAWAEHLGLVGWFDFAEKH